VIRTLRRLIGNRSGNFGLMFGLTAVPVVAAMGCALDFSYALTAKTQLQQAADSAAIAALAEQSVGVIAALKAGTIGDVAVGKEDAKAVFQANLDPKLASYITSYDATVKRSATQFTSRVTFAARIPTSFLGIIAKHSIMISGTAQGSYVPATWVDFYLMLDNSPSMGLGATTADIATLESKTGCALACHTTNPSITDIYSTIASMGVTTRIQVVSKAAQAMMTTATSTRKYADQYRMAVYSMGASATTMSLTNNSPMSSDLATVASDTAKIDLMSIFDHSAPNQQTDLLGNLTSLKTIIGTGGSGANASDRQKVLFLVSDGVEDIPRSPGCLKPLTGTRCQQPIDYSICTKIKAAGVRIAVLYTTYYPIPSDSWYTKWIKPFHDDIGTNMKACASPDLFFEVSPSDGIPEAMNALFLKIVNLPKLTG
jgi:Flp pilus assembly protein TadG